MKSLFAKILIWFLATTVITAVGSAVIARLSDPEWQNPAERFRGRVIFELREARYAYETGGRDALADFAKRLNEAFPGNRFVTDAAGRDLLSGDDRSALVEAAKTAHRRPFRHGDSVYFARNSEDGRYWYFLPVHPERMRRFPGFALRLWSIWVIPAVLLLCYALARHLTAPVRGLESAVRRFGAGDLSARVGSTRRDELGQLGRTFDQMADRIQSLMAAQRRLLLDISHELRSPLTRLGLAVELARSEQQNGAALDRIQKEADRLNALIGEILSFTRSETSPSGSKAASVRLDRLLEQMVEVGSVEAASQTCHLNLTVAGAVTIEGDQELLWRAIENVVRNAMRHAPAGTAVEISLVEAEDAAVITVRDYGPGVPETSLPHLFDPFYRVEDDRSRSTGGVGLGLAIARRAVELHQGKIIARNADPGLLVEIRLPSASKAAEPAADRAGHTNG